MKFIPRTPQDDLSSLEQLKLLASHFAGSQVCCKTKGCLNPPHPKRKFCYSHLTEAKLAFREHTKICRKKGACINCGRKAIKGTLRCPKHTKTNKERCSAWMKANGHTVWERRKAWSLKTGLCPYCTRRPSLENNLHCQHCKDRSRKLARKRARSKR
jgi:hypothetical protein